MDNELEILIDGQLVDLPPIQEVPVSVTYQLEDKQSFQKKQSSNALSITIPATTNNDEVSNTFANPSIEDLTAGQQFTNFRKGKIKVAGEELLVGKTFLKRGSHTDKPTEYEYDFYGNNADWMIDLKEATLYDLVKRINFIFTKQGIIDSWQFDGTDENLPYVFAPIRYGLAMDSAPSVLTGDNIDDYNMTPEYMKPSLSKYWIIVWALRSVGYKVRSQFMDLPYFRRQVMPWVWGSFLTSDGTKLDVLKFLAKTEGDGAYVEDDYTGYVNPVVTNDSTNGAFDDNNVYQYISNVEMRWTYLTAPQFNFGVLEATFHINAFLHLVVANNSTFVVRVQWFKNGVRVIANDDDGNGSLFVRISTGIGPSFKEVTGNYENWMTTTVHPGDVVSAKIWVHVVQGNFFGVAKGRIIIDEFNIDYFRIPLGGTINFENHLAFKNYKVLDFIGGVVDEFDWSIQTDSISKIVYIEPTHAFAIGNDLSQKQGGYFNGNYLDWNDKQDLSKKSDLEPFIDTERELYFKYKEDSADGTLKKIQDRNNTVVGQAKYVFPDRFAVGDNSIQNRFFAPTMHYEVKQWDMDGLGPPQMIIMVPENIANTSAGEAQNTFQSKSVYYKGLNPNYRWIFDKVKMTEYPEMFAVNYKSGGENDPILSYCDEQISGITGKGLVRRFYLQRLVNMKDGQTYLTWFKLNRKDVTNILHREFILCKGQKWELINLKYIPLKKESTQVTLRKFCPIINE